MVESEVFEVGLVSEGIPIIRRQYYKTEDMFANPKAKSVGMVYLSKEMSRMIDDMLKEDKISQTRHEDIKTNMPLMGLKYIETPPDKEAAA